MQIESRLVHRFQIEFEFRSVGFCRRRKTGEHEQQLLERGDNQQKYHSTYEDGERIRTQATCVEARGLATAHLISARHNVVLCEEILIF